MNAIGGIGSIGLLIAETSDWEMFSSVVADDTQRWRSAPWLISAKKMLKACWQRNSMRALFAPHYNHLLLKYINYETEFNRIWLTQVVVNRCSKEPDIISINCQSCIHHMLENSRLILIIILISNFNQMLKIRAISFLNARSDDACPQVNSHCWSGIRRGAPGRGPAPKPRNI